MPKWTCIFASIFLFVSCQNNNKIIVKNDSASVGDYGGFNSFPIEGRFTLPYPENLQLDSNELLFYRMYSFDTSLLIHFYKKPDMIKVVCYEMLPAYHRSINDFADDSARLLFFEGYSFILAVDKWESIRLHAGKCLADTNTVFRNDRCADCGFGMIAYNHSIRRSDSKNLDMYDHYARWLKDSLISRFVEKRRPVMVKAK